MTLVLLFLTKTRTDYCITHPSNKYQLTSLVVLLLLQMEVLLVCVGVSLSFGSLLVKTYRIFAIFQKAVAKFKKIVSHNAPKIKNKSTGYKENLYKYELCS